jgi:DNA-binding CsgD family transcriptional regulator
MPYKRTFRPPGRPPRYPAEHSVTELEAKARSLHAQAKRRQDAADQKISQMLASGKTRRQVAGEIGRTPKHVRAAARRARKRTGT